MTLYVPERKVWTRQPPKTQERLNPSNLSEGLIFLSNGGSYANRVTGTLGVNNNNATTVEKEYSAYKTVTNTADRVDFTNTLTKTGQTEYSFACLFKWAGSNGSGHQYLIHRVGDASNFIILSMPVVGSNIGISWGGTATARCSFVPTSGVYYFMTASVPSSGTASAAKLYIDGLVKTHVTDTNGTVFSSSSKNVILGGRSSDNLRNFDGEIALAAIWDRALTDAEHLALSANPWQIFAPRRQWFAIGSTGNTLRVPFKTAAGADDNIWLTTDNTLRFNNAAGYYDPISAITV